MIGREVLVDPKCCTTGKVPERTALSTEAARAADAELARLAKALGHPARVQIVRFLLAQDSCMCGDIVEGDVRFTRAFGVEQ